MKWQFEPRSVHLKALSAVSYIVLLLFYLPHSNEHDEATCVKKIAANGANRVRGNKQ